MRNKSRVKVILSVLIAVIVIAALAYVREYLARRDAEMERKLMAEGNSYAAPVAEDDPLLLRFLSDHADADVILACAADINNDRADDLVVILRGEDANSTVVMISDGDDYYYTDPVPAPRENQRIKFINIDKEDDFEVMISGEKNSQVGYAVFKLRNGQFRDLYGEGMKDCC